MSISSTALLGTIQIQAGQNVPTTGTAYFTSGSHTGDGVLVTVFAGTGATAGTIEFSPDSGVTWYTLQDSTSTDLSLPLATKAKNYFDIPNIYGRWRPRLTVAPGAAVTYTITKSYTV